MKAGVVALFYFLILYHNLAQPGFMFARESK